jgi:microcystin-dependent protein
MSDAFIAEIRVFPYNFAPTGWATCDGQLLPISQNTALFSLLGTSYGGNGTTNFGLPDLRDRFALGAGQGAGLSDHFVGELGGEAAVTLLPPQLPAHSHALRATASATTTQPSGAALAPPVDGGAAYRAPGVLAAMAAESIGPTGSAGAHENRQPHQALNFCIALQGIFPPRS